MRPRLLSNGIGALAVALAMVLATAPSASGDPGDDASIPATSTAEVDAVEPPLPSEDAEPTKPAADTSETESIPVVGDPSTIDGDKIDGDTVDVDTVDVDPAADPRTGESSSESDETVPTGGSDPAEESTGATDEPWGVPDLSADSADTDDADSDRPAGSTASAIVAEAVSTEHTAGFVRSQGGLLYINKSGSTVVLVTVVDGVEVDSQTVEPGTSVHVLECTSSQTCSFRANREDGLPDALHTTRPQGAPIAPWISSESTSVGFGYGAGFTKGDGVVRYTNRQDFAVNITTAGASSPHFSTVLPGQTVDLPECVTETTACMYMADLYVADGQLLSEDLLIIQTDGSVIHRYSGLGAGFVYVPEGVQYSNTSGRVMTVGFEADGEERQTMTVYPGDTVVLLPCDNTMTTCVYNLVSISGDGTIEWTVSTTVTNFAVDGPTGPEIPTDPETPTGPTTPTTPGTPVRTPSPTRVTDESEPPRSVRTPTQKVYLSPGRASASLTDRIGDELAPPSEFDLGVVCSQLGDFGGVVNSPILQTYAASCQAAKLSYEIAQGDYSGIATASVGVLQTVLRSQGPLGYVASVGVDLLVFAVQEGTKTDWSTRSLQDTAAFAAANPGVVIEEIGKAVVTVAGEAALSIVRIFKPW